MLQIVSGPTMIFGTFDVFHPGHRFFIEQARGKGLAFSVQGLEKKLIIVVARDLTVKQLKGVLRNPEQIRKKVLEQAFPNAVVVLGDEKDPMKVVRKYRPSLVCLGYDQVGFSEELRKKYPEIRIERIKAYQPEKYKSSKF